MTLAESLRADARLVRNIPGAIVGVRKLRGRCVEQDLGVLQRIVSDFGGRMALDGWVIAPGPVAVGDEVTLLE